MNNKNNNENLFSDEEWIYISKEGKQILQDTGLKEYNLIVDKDGDLAKSLKIECLGDKQFEIKLKNLPKVKDYTKALKRNIEIYKQSKILEEKYKKIRCLSLIILFLIIFCK